jgi:hypothetical protein
MASRETRHERFMPKLRKKNNPYILISEEIKNSLIPSAGIRKM